MKKLLLGFFILAFGQSVWAACSGPAGVIGQTQWIAPSNQVQWCNGTTWVDPFVSNSLSCVGFPQGSINYDSGIMRYCDGSFWQNMDGAAIGSCLGSNAGAMTWDSSRYMMKYCDGGFWRAMFSSAGAPQMGSLGINNNDTFTNNNIFRINLSASAVDGKASITHFCLKYSMDATPPAAPGVSDTCWTAVNLPSPGIQPSPGISFANFYFGVGFTPGVYTLFAWVKDGLDQVSALTNSGNGTNTLDLASIDFNPGMAPIIANVFATNANGTTVPPSSSDLMIPAGNDVYIKWKLTDDEALPANPVTLYYTTDEVNFTLITSNLPNTATAGCTVDGVNSTGCFKWTGGSPTSGYFKVRVSATDSANLTSILSSEPNNMGLFKVLAGTTDPGLGGSAASAVMYPRGSGGMTTGAGCFVVRENGMMFVCDSRGLMVIDPLDGKYKIFLRYTGIRNDGPLASATLTTHPAKIALDYNDRLLIYEGDYIRRVDFTTNQITTIVGGGAFTANGTMASDFRLESVGNNASVLFVPLPNGDIWFQSAPDMANPRSAGSKLRFYKATDNRVYTLVPTGTGSLEDAAFDPTNYAIYNYGLSFNPITSQVTAIRSRSIIPTVGGHNPRSVSYDPVTGATTTPHIPFRAYWSDDANITSRNGQMYGFDTFDTNGVFKYVPASGWVRILGTGAKGQCADGTPALSCSVQVTDIFINAQEQLFFIDRGRIRTIDNSGSVLTLFGQSLAYGDGGFAASARINNVQWLGRTDNGKIAFIDNNEFVLREFTPDGLIQKLAGNGTEGNPDQVNPAAAQSIVTYYWGGIFAMVTNPTDGSIYYTRDSGVISKLNRSTGKWEDIVGGGGTNFKDADGLVGNQIGMSGYGQSPFAFNGSTLLRHFHEWDGSNTVNGILKQYEVADGLQSPLAGSVGPIIGGLDSCGPGTPLSSCGVSTNSGPSFSRGNWDAATGRWMLHHVGSNNIHYVKYGTNIDRISLPRGFSAFEYVIKSSVPYLYYCSGGRMYKYNMNTSVETTLFWPSDTVSCQGYSIVWHPTRNSIIFSISQNGLGAIAEIYDP